MTEEKTTVQAPKEIKFLILDDVETFRRLMINDLRKLGYTGEIYEADCLAATVEICESSSFDFIISDWNLPDGTGYDFLVKMKANDQFKKIPFIMFSTIDDMEHMVNAIGAGASEFIVKPWIFEDLQDKLNFAWQKHLAS